MGRAKRTAKARGTDALVSSGLGEMLNVVKRLDLTSLEMRLEGGMGLVQRVGL